MADSPQVKNSISTGISLFALGVSILSFTINSANRDDNRALSKLDLKPEILFFPDFTNQTVTIHNLGPVSAVQLEVQYSPLCVSTDSKVTCWGSLYDLNNPKLIEALPAMSSLSYPVHVDPMIQSLKLPSPPNTYRILDFLVSYKRESDLKRYLGRAFFFLNSHGRIVDEWDNSLPREVYQPILEVAAKSSPSTPLPLGNPLREVEQFWDSLSLLKKAFNPPQMATTLRPPRPNHKKNDT